MHHHATARWHFLANWNSGRATTNIFEVCTVCTVVGCDGRNKTRCKTKIRPFGLESRDSGRGGGS
jgi:hypothetical protein